MVHEKKEARIKKLLRVMERERGYLPPSYRYIANKDPDFLEAYNNLYDRALTDGKALPAKMRELIAIPLLAYRGHHEAVYEHCKRALKLGATKQELLEAIETSIIPGGVPTFGNGLRALVRIDEDEKKEKEEGKRSKYK
jgi:alkylhydroperoxidase/carboxymuconolactone decarboxylase family protein YurZ